jgi:hypothetical protein
MANTDEGTTTITKFVAACLEQNIPPVRPLPILLLLGRRGTGKTTLLDRLDKTLNEPRPRARLDLGRPGADPDPVAILAGLMSQLHPGAHYVGVIPFPRFGLGLLALDLNPGDTLTERRSQLDTPLKNPSAAPLNAMLQRVLDDLTSNWQPDQRAGVVIAEWVTGWLINSAKRRQTENLMQWYAGRDAGLGGADQNTLYRLCEWRAEPGTAWRTEKTLCAAFLADLRAHFNQPRLRRPWRLSTKCLVLLDNTGSTEGTRFLGTLAECRAEMSRSADPLVVVAGHHTWPEADLGPGPLIDARISASHPAEATIHGPDYTRWHEQTRNLPDPPLWYPVKLADLDDHGMRRMVTSRELDGKHGHDADFIHALTGGHLGTAATLAAALKDGHADHRDLLKEHDLLLRTLFPDDLDDTMLKAMTVCAVTPGCRLAACNAVFKFLRFTGATAEDVHDRLTATMWATERSDGDLDLHPLPRQLLLRRLADDPAWWRQVHEGYQTYYATDRNETGLWYHKLACEEPGRTGELGQLIQRMDTRLGELPPHTWCDELDNITAAPNMLQTREDPWDVVATLAGPAPGDGLDRRRTVARIIVAQWLHQDRLFDPRHALARLLNTEYWNLAGCIKPNGGVFGRRAAQFGKTAKEWGWMQ